jgi:poly [ADP-ribose] polymerase
VAGRTKNPDNVIDLPEDATEARLVMVDLEGNNNKFWEARVEGCRMVGRFGRVGESGTPIDKTFESEDKALRFFRSKVREKARHDYTLQRTSGGSAEGQVTVRTGPVSRSSLGELAAAQMASDPETASLVRFLADRNVHAIEGATSIRLEAGSLVTPLGPVTPEGVEEAALLLDRIGDLVARGGDPTSALVSAYLRIVPRDLGRRRTEPREVFPTPDSVARELDTLQAVRQAVADAEAASAAGAGGAGGTEAPRLFRTSLTPRQDAEREVARLFAATLNRNHQSARLRLRRVWLVACEPADGAWAARGERVGNVERLWHGTTDANLLSLLKSGYIVPRHGGSARITGRMFGDGVYFSNQSTKSLNYATGFWGGGASGRTFMLLNDVATGRRYHPRSSFSGRPPAGYDSAWIEPGTAGVRNHECIVYDPAQCRPVYLAEFG